MKARLDFDLEDPLDQNAHRRCVNATNAYIVFHDLSNHFRSIRKYDQELSTEQKEAVSKVEDYFLNLLKEYNIDLNDLE